MARPVEWFQHLPRILAHLADPASPALLTRPHIQLLFGVERRNAQHLLHRFGAARLGNQLVLDRQHLLAQLQALAAGEDFAREQRRHDRVRGVVADARATWQLSRVSLPEPTARSLRQLPASIRLAPGRLSVDFSDAVDLLGQLLELSQAIGEDFERFEALLNQDPLLS